MRRFLVMALLVTTGCLGRISDPKGTTTPGAVDPTLDPTDPKVCIPGRPPITPRLRRLSFLQYDRTVEALVGIDLSPSTELGPEVDGIPPVMWSGVRTAAARIAAAVIADQTRFDAIVLCSPTGDGAACAETFVRTFGRRAYRRALTDTEVARYTTLYSMKSDVTENDTFAEGIGVLLEAFLQAPTFLLRVEATTVEDGGVIRLSGAERATRMAYALWNAPPDDTLLDAADRGDLDTKEGVQAEARRMLTAGEGRMRARQMLRSAHADWLGMVGAYGAFWSNTQRDTALFPEFVPGIDASFREEVLRFSDVVAFERDGGFRDLMLSNVTQVNTELAPIYGLQGDFSQWTTVELDANQRPGLLTRAGFVGTHGRFGRGSLIYRGAFVLKRILCEEIGSPPAGADATPLPDTAGLRTTRQRIEAMTSGQPCATCHTRRVNPAGFAMESFDGIGRYREQEDGVNVDTSGTFELDGAVMNYGNAREFAEAIAASKTAQQCYVDRFTEFTFGEADVRLDCGGGALSQRLGDPNVSLTDFLVDLVSDDNFLYRATEEAP